VTTDGKAKRVPADQFPVQGRYGQGVVAWKLPRTAALVGIASTSGGKARPAASRLTLHLDKLAPKALRFDDAPLQTRAAQGKTVVELKAGDRVVYITISDDLSRSQDKPGGVQEPPKPKRAARKAPAAAPAAGEHVGETAEKVKPAALEGKPAAKPKVSAVKTTGSEKTDKAVKAPSKEKPSGTVTPAPEKAGEKGKSAAAAKKPAALKTSAAVKGAAVEKKIAALNTTPAAKATSKKMTTAPAKSTLAEKPVPPPIKSAAKGTAETGGKKPSPSKDLSAKTQLTFEDITVPAPKTAPGKKTTPVKSTPSVKKASTQKPPVVEKKSGTKAAKASKAKPASGAKPARAKPIAAAIKPSAAKGKADEKISPSAEKTSRVKKPAPSKVKTVKESPPAAVKPSPTKKPAGKK
jgi:hypothetical protein